jgi:uncharacterized alpha-E superfamily protein
MLSRVADALYWMARYVERAEHASRVLSVLQETQIDLHDLDPSGAPAHEQATLAALGISEPGLPLERIVFDETLAASVASSIQRARENARQVREVISNEMWLHLNQAYWSLREAHGATDRGLEQTLSGVVDSCMLWAGVTDGTMQRGEGWLFIRLGQFVERADRICRLVNLASSRLSTLTDDAAVRDADNVTLLMLLRSCCALETFRKVSPYRVTPRQVVGFLVFDAEFPHTVGYSVHVAQQFANRLCAQRDEARAVERAFGRLAARLDYGDVDELLEAGPEKYLSSVLLDLAQGSLSVQRTFFLH